VIFCPSCPLAERGTGASEKRAALSEFSVLGQQRHSQNVATLAQGVEWLWMVNHSVAAVLIPCTTSLPCTALQPLMRKMLLPCSVPLRHAAQAFSETSGGKFEPPRPVLLAVSTLFKSRASR